MKIKKAYNGKGLHPRHRFLFVIGGKTVPISTKVASGAKKWSATLTETHVQRAIKLNGHGDGANCAGAVCVKDHSNVIPNKFTGYVDFWDTRAFLSSRNSASNLPTHCIAWKHNQPQIAKWFDNKVGLQKLLETIRKEGPITIDFEPPTYRSGTPRPNRSGEKDPMKRENSERDITPGPFV